MQPSAIAAPGNDADARLRALYAAEWAWRRQQFPDDENGRKPIPDRLPKVDAASQEARLAYWTRVMRELDAIPRGELSPVEQVNYDVYRPQIATLIAGQRFRDYEMPVNSDTAFWMELSYTARKLFKTPADYKNFIAQMRDIPRYFDEQIEAMRAGLKRGFTPPQVTLKGRDASLAAVTDPMPEETPLYAPFKDIPAFVPAGEQAQLRAEAVTVIRDLVQPAYAKVLAFMRDEYVPGARNTLAAEALPGGKAWYRAQILEYTTRDMEAVEIHQIGLEEVAKLLACMAAEMKATGFEGDFPAFLHHLRTDPKFYAKTPEELLMRAAWIAKTFDGKAAQYFGRMPKRRFSIKPVPDDMAPYYTSGRAWTDHGLYLLNTHNLPQRPLYNLVALTLHEAEPGHLFQIPLAMEHKEQPEFRQQTYISAYGEGWALYCERLGLEMGMYETPYDRFGMYNYQIWRAARLVVDTGVHSHGWTREQSIQYLRDNTALAEHEIETEVDRYIAWPGQALSYYVGEMTILEARAKAEAALGSKFSIRAFHDAVLELGGVPLPVLEAHIDRFIAEGGKGPYPDEE
jgi:uncharacterized protein (DUF885 family)